MDLETIKRINRDALRAAQEQGSGSSAPSNINNQQMIMYFVALACAVAFYFILQSWRPNFVMSGEDSNRQFDHGRAVIASIIVGLLVVLCYFLMYQ